MPAHVLLYDQTPALLAQIGSAFLDAGFQTTTRHPQTVSVGQIQSLMPDVLVLGYRLGVPKSELDIVKQLREIPDFVDLPIIVATPAEQKMSLSFDAGNTHHAEFQLEPFSADAVVSLAQKLIAKR